MLSSQPFALRNNASVNERSSVNRPAPSLSASARARSRMGRKGGDAEERCVTTFFRLSHSGPIVRELGALSFLARMAASPRATVHEAVKSARQTLARHHVNGSGIFRARREGGPSPSSFEAINPAVELPLDSRPILSRSRRSVGVPMGPLVAKLVVLQLSSNSLLDPLSISWSGKRNFAGRDSRAISGAERGRTVGIRFADRDTPR